MAQSAPHSSKKFPLPVLIFFLVFARSAESQGINYILEACNSELYKSLPTDEAISGKYYTNNQLVDKSSPYAPDLNCSSYIPYPEGGSIVLKFVLFEIEFDPDTAVSASFPCEFDQFSINGENYCGILTGDEKCFHGGTQVNFTLTTDYYTEDLYHGIEIHFDTYSTNQCACMTLATETEDSKQCIFPFVFRDVKYYSCVDDVLTNEMNVNGSFCATETLGNGTLTEAGSCDTSIVDCQPVCRTETGKRCLFPAYSGGIERTACWKNFDGESNKCAVLQGVTSDDAIGATLRGTCGSQCDISLECGMQNMALNSAQFLSPEYNPKAENSYLFDQNCEASVDTTSADSYYVTLARVSLVCDERDFLEVKSPSSSGVPVYRFCGETLDTQFEDFSFCWSSNIEDSVEMTILFKSGDDQTIEPNRYDRTGVDLSFKATETSEAGPCVPRVGNDNACNSGSQVIDSDYEILSYDYPRPYPSDLDCTWTIEADDSRPGTIPVIEIQGADLGIEWGSITEKDTLTFKNPSYQDDRVITLDNDDSDQAPFVLIGQSGSVTFKSTFYFNFHTTFKLNVNYYTIADNREVFVSAGYCLSEDYTDLCHFPFLEDGKAYTKCFKLGEDSKASCKNYRQEKIFCDQSALLCIPPIPAWGNISATINTSSSVRVDWQVENRNWHKFIVTINEDPPAEVFTESYEAGNLMVDTFYEVKIQMISFERESPVQTISFTHTGQSFGVFATSETPGVLTLKWDQFPNLETSYTVSVAPRFTTSVSQSLFVDKTAEAPSTVAGNVFNKDLENLRAGLGYDAKVEGFTNSGATKTTEVETFKFIMPNSFDQVTNSIVLEVVPGIGLRVNGEMTSGTYCEQINVRVEMLKAEGGMEFFEEVSEKQCAVDDCVDTTDFTFKSVIAMEESELTPGASYKIFVFGSSEDVVAPGEVSLNYLREPGKVSTLEAATWDTNSISVKWDPPSGEYAHFVVNVTQADDALAYSKESKVAETTFMVSKLQPGHSYNFTVKTVSHEDKESVIAVQETFGTNPLRASLFSVLQTSDDPSEVTFQALPPESGAWKTMEISSKGLVFQEVPGQSLADKEFPISLNKAELNLKVQYSQNGSLYTAWLEVVSELGNHSANITKLFATAPSKLERAELTFMNNDYMTIEWALSKSESSFYNQLAAVVKTADGETTIYDQSIIVAEQETGGSLDIPLQEQDPSTDFTATLNAMVYFPQYDVTAKSSDSIEVINPVIPLISDLNPVTLTTITATLDLSGFASSDVITVTVEKPDGTEISNLDVDASNCASISACPAVLSSLDPATDYVVKSSVKQSDLPYRITSEQSATTNTVPTSFTIDMESTVIRSYSIVLCFNNRPFGVDSLLDKFVLLVGTEGANESQILANVETNVTWAQNSGNGSLVYVSSTKQDYSSISLDGSNRWKLTVGDETCDPAAPNDVCNGPLLPDTGYNFWIAGFTTNAKIIFSQKISNIKTTVDDTANSVVTSELSIIKVEFNHTLPDSANYTGTVLALGNDELLSSQELAGNTCSGGKCSITFVDLDPGSSYTVQVTPQLSGVNRTKFTATLTTAGLPDFTLQQIEVAENVNPSVAFAVEVNGLPFGSHTSVTEYSIIVASTAFTGELLTIPDAKYSDVENRRPFKPFRPLEPQTYPPHLIDGKFQLTVGGQDCSGVGSDAHCNGYLPWNSQFQIWLATVPENSQEALIRGPFSPYITAELMLDAPMVLVRAILSLKVGYPVEDLPDGSMLDIQVLNSTDEEVSSVDGVAPKEGTGCALSDNLNHCIVTIQGLDPETEYTIKFIRRDNSITEELTGKTRPIPTMDVVLDTDNDDRYTTLKFSVTDLPFGQEDNIASYYVVVSSTENKDHVAYTESVWKDAVSDNWAPYNAFGALSYADLIFEFNQAQSGTWSLVIGQEFPCTNSVTNHCNGPLEPGEMYVWTIFVETESGRKFQTEVFDGGYSSLTVESTLAHISRSLAGMTLQFDKLESSVITYTITVSLNNEVKASKVIRATQCSESKCDVTIDTLDAANSYVAMLFVNYNNAPADIAESKLESLIVPTVTDLVPDVQVGLTPATSMTESFNQMSFTLNKLPFGDTQSVGGVLLYSVVISMVTTSNVGGGTRARRNADDHIKFTNNTWKFSSENGWPPYLMKGLQLYPPSDTNQDGSWSVAVGAEYPCLDDVTRYCNGPLAPGSSFSLALIGYVGESKYPVLSQSSSQLTTGTYKVTSTSGVQGKLTSVDFQFTNGMPPDSFGFLAFRAQALDSNQQVISTVLLNPTSCSDDNVCNMSVGGLEPDTSYSLVVTPVIKGLPMEPSSPQPFPTLSLPTTTVTKDDDTDNIDSSTQIALQITGLPFGSGDSRIKKYSILIGQSNNNFSQQLQSYPQDVKTYETAEASDLYKALPLTDYPPELSGTDPDVWGFVLGSHQDCKKVQTGEECNGPLTPSKSYNIWFVAEIEDYGFLTTAEFGPFLTTAVPGGGYSIASLSPLFIVLGILLLLILVLILLIFMRRRGKIRIYPFLSCFALQERKKLFAYEAHDDLSEHDCSTPRLHESPELTNSELADTPLDISNVPGPSSREVPYHSTLHESPDPTNSEPPDTPLDTSTVSARSSREAPYHSTLKSTTEVVASSQGQGPSPPIPSFSASAQSSVNESPRQSACLEDTTFQFSGIVPQDDDSFSQDRPYVIRPNFIEEEDKEGLVSRAPRHIKAEKNQKKRVSQHPYLDLASQFN